MNTVLMQFKDKPNVQRDTEKLIRFYQRVGFQKIFVSNNPTRKDIDETFKEILAIMVDAHAT